MLLNLLNDKLLFQLETYEHKRNNIFSYKNLTFIALIEITHRVLIALSFSTIDDVFDKDYLELNLYIVSSSKSIAKSIDIY